MKKFIALIPAAVLAACTTGQISVQKDEYAQEEMKTLDLGQIKSAKSFGLIYEIRAKVTKREKADKSSDYFIELSTHAEGNSCAKIKNGARVIFLVDGKPFEYTTVKEPLMQDKAVGLLGPACEESGIKIGPIPRDVIERMVAQHVVKFKVYGTLYDLEAMIEKDDLNVMKRILNQ